MEIIQVASVVVTVTGRGIALYQRRKAGMGLMDRHAPGSNMKVLTTSLVAMPVASAAQLYRIRRGTTLLRNRTITRIGKVEAAAELVQTVIVAGTAGAELYRTRETWLPELKRSARDFKTEAVLYLLQRKLKNSKQHVAPPVPDVGIFVKAVMDGQSTDPRQGSIDDLVGAISMLLAQDFRDALGQPDPGDSIPPSGS